MNIKKTLIALCLLGCILNSYANPFEFLLQAPAEATGDADTYTIPIGVKCLRTDPTRTMQCTEACKRKGFERGICKVPNPTVSSPAGRCYCRYY